MLAARARPVLRSPGFWTLADQAVVSLGTFITNIALARYLEPAGYGVFVLISGAMLILQMVNSALIFYPLSIRGAVAPAGSLPVLMGQAGLLTLACSAAYCLPLAAVPLIIGRSDLIVPLLLCFLALQCQEGMRRGLFATLRHRHALPGDILSYGGQAALAVGLAAWGRLDVAVMLQGMAGLALCGSLVQFHRLAPAWPEAASLPPVARDFLRTGHWALTANLVSIFRYQALVWMATAAGGVAAAGSLQAVANLANLANPLILGLCNIVPQMAARGQANNGNAGGWLAVRRYILLGAGPAILFYVLLMVAPNRWLSHVYGEEYAGLGLALGVMAAAMAGNYVADMICSYLVGVNRARQSFTVGLAGAAVSVAAGVPLVIQWGVAGACAAMLAASLLRAGLCCRLIRNLGSRGAAYA